MPFAGEINSIEIALGAEVDEPEEVEAFGLVLEIGIEKLKEGKGVERGFEVGTASTFDGCKRS